MKTNKKSFSIALTSLFLTIFPILFSFTASADTGQNISSKRPYANVTGIDSNTNSVIDTSNNTVIAMTSAGDHEVASGQSIAYPTQSPVFPVANFSTNGTSGLDPLTVKFTDLSANATGVKWDLGDGEYSAERNPTHTYIMPRDYTVTLTINGQWTQGTTSKVVRVRNPKAPVADFSTSPITGVVPLKVAFTDKSNGEPTSWGWSFGDGTCSKCENPSHTYCKAGKYIITLTIKDANGNKDKKCKCNFQ